VAPSALAGVTRRTLLVASLLCLAACSARRHATVAEAPLRVGTSGDYPPFSERAADGSWTGFDLEVAREYAAARGRRLEVVPLRWADLAARVAAGDVDVAMSGITVRADRLLVGTMTAAVARADAVILVRRDDATTGGSFDRAGVRIAVNRGGHLERLARSRVARATLVPVDDNRRLPILLANREVAAIVTDTLEAATFPDTFAVAAVLAHDRKAYWVAPGRDALAADLDAWLLERERDGYLPRLRIDRLHASDAPGPAPELARVVDLVARRLMLMPEVGAAKRAAGMPIVDAKRESDVIARAVERARAAGLDGTAAEHLARAEIMAARAVQEAARAEGAPRPPDAPSLATLRGTIDALDAAILRALVGARATAPDVRRPALSAALRADADLLGFDEAHSGAIAAALAELLRAEIVR
jgi:cyclohexadienyl dehydratase